MKNEYNEREIYIYKRVHGVYAWTFFHPLTLGGGYDLYFNQPQGDHTRILVSIWGRTHVIHLYTQSVIKTWQ